MGFFGQASSASWTKGLVFEGHKMRYCMPWQIWGESKSTTHCERHLCAKLDDANFLRQCAGPLREGNATTRIANLHMVRVSLGSKCWFEARCEPKHLLYKLHTYYPCKHLLVNFCSARSRTMIDTVGFCPDMELLPDCNAPQTRFEWLCLHMLVQSIV